MFGVSRSMSAQNSSAWRVCGVIRWVAVVSVVLFVTFAFSTRRGQTDTLAFHEDEKVLEASSTTTLPPKAEASRLRAEEEHNKVKAQEAQLEQDEELELARQSPRSTTTVPRYPEDVDSMVGVGVVDTSVLTSVTTPALDRLTNAVGRVYCAVPTMYQKSKFELWNAILRTWGRRCDVLKFFVDPLRDEDGNSVPVPETKYVDSETGFSVDIVELPMKHKAYGCFAGDPNRPCRNIWEKVWRMWVWVYDHDLDKAEWFLKNDDDTFTIPENLKRYVHTQKWSAEEEHYFGHMLSHKGVEVSLIAGALTAFSRATLAKVAPVYKTLPPKSHPTRGRECVERTGPQEEIGTSSCLRSVNIQPEATYNHRGEERVILFVVDAQVRTIRRPDSKGWFFKNKPQIIQGGQRCCAVDAFGMHDLKNPVFHQNINELVYGDNHKLEAIINDRERIKKLEAEIKANPTSIQGHVSLITERRVGATSLLFEVRFLLALKANIAALRAGNIDGMP